MVKTGAEGVGARGEWRAVGGGGGQRGPDCLSDHDKSLKKG